MYINIGSNKELINKLGSQKVDASLFVGADAQSLLDKRIKDLESFLSSSRGGYFAGQSEILTKYSDILTSCNNSLRQAKQFLPSQQKLNEFRNKLKTYKRDFTKRLSQKISPESAKVLAKEVDGWKDSFPPTYDEYKKILLAKLQNDYAVTINGARLAGDLFRENSQLVTAVDLFSNQDFKSDPKYGQDLIETCKDSAPEISRDKAFMGSDKWEVGPLSVSDPKFGEMACKHEFGHLLSGLISNGKMSLKTKKWYNEVRSCLQRAKSSDKYVEEDWADYISSQTGGSHHGWCRHTPNMKEYVTLKGDSKDTHSSYLFRQLHFLTVQGQSIPEACKDALKENGEEVIIPRCTASTSSR